MDDLSSVDSKGLSDEVCEVILRIKKQSPDTAGGVHVGKDGMVLEPMNRASGLATRLIILNTMPLIHSMAKRLGKKLTGARGWQIVVVAPRWRDSGYHRVRGESRCLGGAQEVHTIVISTQHAEPVKAVRTKECAGDSTPEMTAPQQGGDEQAHP